MNIVTLKPVRARALLFAMLCLTGPLVSCASATQPSPVPAGGFTNNGSGNGIQTLPASSWRILTNGRSATLAEALSASGYSAAIFQFAGVTCDTCQRDATDYTRRIQASPLRGRIGHIVVFTDFPEDFQESDFQSFLTQYAPQSVRAHDDRAKLWLSLQKNPSAPDRNVIVVLGQGNRGLFLNEPASRDTIFNALESLGSAGGRIQ